MAGASVAASATLEPPVPAPPVPAAPPIPAAPPVVPPPSDVLAPDAPPVLEVVAPLAPVLVAASVEPPWPPADEEPPPDPLSVPLDEVDVVDDDDVAVPPRPVEPLAPPVTAGFTSSK
jgi:hypothetical protein